MPEVILQARHVAVEYPARRTPLSRRPPALRAVDDVSFSLRAGQSLGIVGESGCGKSTLARTLTALQAPSGGAVLLRDRNLHELRPAQLRQARRHIQLVLQDPYASLNPRMTAGEAVREPLEIHRELCARPARTARVAELLGLVGLPAAAAGRYPHQFSGGERQRVALARALAVRPEILVCDESVSSLDVSVQAQVLGLLRSLRAELGLGYVFIAHDLPVVRYVCDRIAVMYLGRIVEIGDKASVCAAPSHPYTQALFSAAPVPDPALRGRRQRIVLAGDVPSPLHRPSGCRFRTRCWKAAPICAETEPELAPVPGTTLAAACHFATPRTMPQATVTQS
jgi:oligopeptide transport system ATP-binding protein